MALTIIQLLALLLAAGELHDGFALDGHADSLDVHAAIVLIREAGTG